MNHVLSMSDLLLATPLAKYTEHDLLSIKMDKLVNSILDKVGFDITKPIVYVPKKHRNMRHQVLVGFQCVGTYKNDRDTLSKFVPSAFERALVYAESDVSFTLEMLSLLNKTVDYEMFSSEDDGGKKPDMEFYASLTEHDYVQTLQLLKHLEEVRDSIRGSVYDESGNPKTASQYMEYYNNNKGSV